MKKNRSYSNMSQIIRLLIVNHLTTVIGLAVVSLISGAIAFKLDLADEIMYYVTFPVIAVVALVNGFFLAREIKSKGWLVGIISNVVFMTYLIIGHLISKENRFDKYFAIKIAIVIIVGIVGGVIGVNKKKKFK